MLIALHSNTTCWNAYSAATIVAATIATTYRYYVDLFLSFACISFAITYDVNNPTSGTAPDLQTKTEGTALILAANTGTLTKDGLRFAGWNTQSNGTGTTYAVGKSYTTDENVTLYAKWSNSWVGTDTKGIILNGTEYTKTTEKVIITSDATITGSDSSWSTYYNGRFTFYKGVFIQGHTVTLSPFIISKYEVTQELYQAIMGTNPSGFKDSPEGSEAQKLRPVDTVTWYDAVLFCNKLTKEIMSENECVYYTDNTFTTVYENGDSVYMNPAKKGYRLPTDTEWEFAARGGSPDGSTWGYAYAGVQGENVPKAFNSSPYYDTQLNTCGWNSNNSNKRTHEVGILKPNALDLYDMSGNIAELCYDYWYRSVTIGTETNPLGSETGEYRIRRGNNWFQMASNCLVAIMDSIAPNETDNQIGFRVCRSSE